MDNILELLKKVFGFVLSFLSRIIWERKNQKREKKRQEESEKKEDERLLREIRKILLEITRAGTSRLALRSTIECMDELSQLSIGIKRKENEMIKLDIRKFSRKYRLSVSILTQESKEMRKEAEKLIEKIDIKLGISDDEKNNRSQGGE